MTDKPKPGNALVETRRDIEAMTTEFAKALPRQMPSERFVRTVNTAIQLNPDLAAADRRSLMAACMKAAQDGLLPDGREGALVIYNTKTKVQENGREVERWVKNVQWSPMVAGLMKKARNSGEIAGISASVVFRHDHFKLVKGDDERFDLFTIVVQLKALERPYKGPGTAVGNRYLFATFNFNRDVGNPEHKKSIEQMLDCL